MASNGHAVAASLLDSVTGPSSFPVDNNPHVSLPQRDSVRAPGNHPQQSLEELLDSTNPELLVQGFGVPERGTAEQLQVSNRIGRFLIEMSEPGPLRDNFKLAIDNSELDKDEAAQVRSQEQTNLLMERERKSRAAYRIHKDRFPTSIWHCCSNICFATIATDPLYYMIMDELIAIHDHANRYHTLREDINLMVAKRRPGIGTSNVGFVASSRSEREAATSVEPCRSARDKALRSFGTFVVEVLPFLYGQSRTPLGTLPPTKKLCTTAICCILGVSRNFLYNRKMIQRIPNASEDELTSLIDTAGLRMRQHRRNGDRRNYEELHTLPDFNCGCDVPCLAEVPQWTLFSEYNEFIKLARELKPRHKENRFLLNRLFCPLTNTVIRVCNTAISQLFTVSESLVADVRRSLHAMCSDPSLSDRPLLTNGTVRYRYHQSHPMNRYPDAIREKIESHLDMVLRADPAGSSGSSVCRVYSPEINTQDKLQTLLRKLLGTDDSVGSELSSSTIQRMINDYLRKRNLSAISFTQSDHNACPTCKTLHYAILQYYHEAKFMERDLQELLGLPRPLLEADQKRADELQEDIRSKKFQEDECLNEFTTHNSRDARIRKSIKGLGDHFREVETKYRTRNSSAFHPQALAFSESVQWNIFHDRGCITHQDDMSKVDLPHFVVTASSDITRWRFDVNAHVSSVTNDALVLSHEQGTGPKNASAIVEEILLSHLLRCRGEAIKIIVSDNAAVGKNWITTVALPQYLVDQGLAEVVLILFLENNHGKWLADMLFGQFQNRRRRETLLGIDDMLCGFESVKRSTGKVQGFAINPLSSIEFSTVFGSLGYETKPPSDFGFVKRNIHFAGACSAGAKQRLPVELRDIIGPALPDDLGMVRLSTEPPGQFAQSELRYEDRYFEVPAAHLPRSSMEEDVAREVQSESDEGFAPVVVPMDQPFSPGGKCVVSQRTATHVGYNGLSFRTLRACPEMKDTSKPLVRQAWPKGLLEGHEEPVAESESIKCAPTNWIVRRPVRHFCVSTSDWKARYPPQNMLNARYGQGPRDSHPWIPVATYDEPPFPIIEGTAASSAMKKLAEKNQDIGKTLNVLDALREVYEDMGDRHSVSDLWLQWKVTRPSRRALELYRSEMDIYRAREAGHPKAPKTLRQVFKGDEKVLEEVDEVLSDHSVSGPLERSLRNKTVSMLFDDAEKTPGGLDRFYNLVEKDKERYARELENFKNKQANFDREYGLLPSQ